MVHEPLIQGALRLELMGDRCLFMHMLEKRRLCPLLLIDNLLLLHPLYCGEIVIVHT